MTITIGQVCSWLACFGAALMVVRAVEVAVIWRRWDLRREHVLWFMTLGAHGTRHPRMGPE